ncbi:Phox/Bem1p [Artemisia annua]|uniref:Phox/Bem1p n=1 Tax=Artemisia annua TaxID=35608 RepID=A0A2U1Q958_ARTAN|nr:Phox/Bem1p [Artemisia annua]
MDSNLSKENILRYNNETFTVEQAAARCGGYPKSSGYVSTGARTTTIDESRPVPLPHSNPLPRPELIVTSSPLYYPNTAPAVPDSAFLGLNYPNVVPAPANWLPVSVAATGVGLAPYPYNNNNTSASASVAALVTHGYDVNLVPPNTTGLAPHGFEPNLALAGVSNNSTGLASAGDNSMAYDQNNSSNNNNLRPIHIARTTIDESRPVPLPHSNPLPRAEVIVTSSPLYYPNTAPAVPDSAFLGLNYPNIVPAPANWLPVSVAATGVGLAPVHTYPYNNSNTSATASVAALVTHGYDVNLVPPNTTGLAPHGFEPNLASAGVSNNSTILASAGGSNVSEQVSEEGGEERVRKVKFLCSYGGKILPRPSDGALRYVGGDTRIIGVPRNVGFNELVQKMFDSYGRNVVIKYQLPDEDLDALVTVSRPDDLENMMEEYDKLCERCSDGSAKLRVFLFSDVEASSVIRYKDLQDSGQRYVEANSELSGTEGGVESVGHDQGEAIGPVSGGMMSPGGNSAGGMMSPGGNSAASVPITRAADHESEISERPVTVHVQQQQPFRYDLQQPGPAAIPPPSYVQTYVDPRHGTLSRTEYIQQQDVRMEHFPERVVQISHDQTYMTYQPQPQSQISPPVITRPYGWNQVPPPEQLPFSESRVPTQQVVFPEPVPRFDGCVMCQKALPHAHSDTVAQDRNESPRSNVSDVNPVYQSLRFDDTRRMMQTSRATANDHAMVSAPYGVMVHQVPHYGHESSVQQPVVPMQYQVKHETVVNPVGGPSPTLDSQIRESPREYPANSPVAVIREDNVDSGFTYDNLRPIDARMEDLRIRPSDVLVNNDQRGFRLENPREDILDSRPMNIGGTELNLDNVAAKSQVVLDASYITSAMNNLAGNDANPVFSGGDLARVTEVNPTVGEWTYPLQSEPKSEAETTIADPLNPFIVTGETQDGANSLFSNQDPWMLRHDPQFPPPRPSKLMTKKEGVDESPRADSLIDDGGYQPSPNLDLNVGVEHGFSDKGSAEELIKQELQAVAEGVAASVLHSSTPSNPDSIRRGRSEYGSEANCSVESQDNNPSVQSGVEDLKTKVPEKQNLGFPVSDGAGRLQIIKNIDLEELRELGSGTFGTVYHGKWRGTDVAIKRINDRCFAGKASEQERMREDFWNEAIKLADLHHPNVVAFYGVVLDGPGGSVATVTEFMVNGSLRTALQKNERNLDKRKRLLIAMDVAFGMEYLHEKNIVHFDLKSDNLLVNLRDTHRPVCKVGDLGLSKVKRQTLISGGVRGTLPWMAPELLNGSSSLVSEKVGL